MGDCTAFGCYLERQGGLVSLPLVTLAGLIDGINPCAIGMMVTLLGYLIVFGGKAKGKGKGREQNRQILKIGVAYILSVFVTYLVIGLMFYQLAYQLQQSIWSRVFSLVLGGGLMLAGVIQVKDVFWPELPIHLRIPSVSKKRLDGLVGKASLPAAILLGILVTILETPCSLPLYVGTATVLATSGMGMAGVVGYFLYYNFLFVLPLIVVLVVMYKGREVVVMREWEHGAKKWMHLGLGVALLVLGGWLMMK
jgi:cytochrome c biogenesis protein CcdA